MTHRSIPLPEIVTALGMGRSKYNAARRLGIQGSNLRRQMIAANLYFFLKGKPGDVVAFVMRAETTQPIGNNPMGHGVTIGKGVKNAECRRQE